MKQRRPGSRDPELRSFPGRVRSHSQCAPVAGRRPFLAACVACALLLIASVTAVIGPSTAFATSAVPPVAQAPAISSNFGHLQLFFEPNQGQADENILFIARGRDRGVYLTRDGAHLSVGSSESGRFIRLSFPGSNPQAFVRGEAPATGRINYLMGQDRTGWHRDIPTFQSVRYEDVYPGVDLVFHANDQQLEYDFIVAPGAAPGSITLRFTGADRMELAENGDLILRAGPVRLRQHRPVAYQDSAGTRREVKSGYRIAGPDTVVFESGAWDPAQPLVIDPCLSYSTYLGGSKKDVGWAIAVDTTGAAYIAGDTMSIFRKIPVSGFQTNFGGGTHYGGDAFIAKLDPTGTNLVFLTYVGGSGLDGAVGLAVDAAGFAYVAGYTDSTNFPTTAGALQTAIAGVYDRVYRDFRSDAFVLKLDPNGTNLIYSTYLGGEENETAVSIAIDPQGNAYVTGTTESAITYRTTNLVCTSTCTNNVCGSSVCVTNVDTNRVLIATQWATNVVKSVIHTNPPTSTNLVTKIISTNLQSSLQITVGFPTTTNALQLNNRGNPNLFITKLSSNGASLIYSTYFGGRGGDYGTGIAVDPAGQVTLCGHSTSTDLGVTNALQPKLAGGRDAFVLKLDATGTNLIYATYLGGSSDDVAYRVALDGTGAAYVVGAEASVDFPSTPAALNKGGVFRSGDAGGSWALDSSGLEHPTVQAFLADPSASGLLYAATPRGVFKTINGGVTWLSANTGLGNRFVNTLAFGSSPGVIYAGTRNGLYLSTNAAATWTNAGVGLFPENIRVILPEPGSPSKMFLGTTLGILRSVDAWTNWATANSGLGNRIVNAIVLDPLDASRVYAATEAGVYRSTNSGARWRSSSTGLSSTKVRALLIDPTNPQTLYAGTARGFYKSLNAATNWVLLTNGLGRPPVNTLLFHPATPTTLYAGTTNGIFKSLDAGLNWMPSQTNLTSRDIISVAFDPFDPSTVYAGARGTNFAGGTNDAFLIKLNPTGSALDYAVTFGEKGTEEAWDVAVDSSGNAFVTGFTTSRKFPVTLSSLSEFTNFLGHSSAFVTAFDPAGTSQLFSIFAGGHGRDVGHGIALDSLGSIYIVGRTDSQRFTVTNAVQPTFGGGHGDAFVMKLVGSPCLSAARVGNALVLRWATSTPAFSLEQSEPGTGRWAPVTANPTVSGGHNVLVLEATASSRLFRLKTAP